jgi:hypothetical protein
MRDREVAVKLRSFITSFIESGRDIMIAAHDYI